MWKETIIIFVSLILIVGLNFYIQIYLEKTSTDLIEKLHELRGQIYRQEENLNNNELKTKANEIYEKWEKTNKLWSTFVLHEELDKIELSLIGMKAGIESDGLINAIQELDQSIFLIGHIKEKEALSWRNIF